MVEQPAPAGSPGQARPRSPSKVRRLAENWHSAPIIEDDTPHPHPLLNEDHLAAVAKQPEPPKPVTDDDDSTHDRPVVSRRNHLPLNEQEFHVHGTNPGVEVACRFICTMV